MALSEEEQMALAAIESGLRQEDPALAKALSTLTRPGRCRWPRALLLSMLIVGLLGLLMGIVERTTVCPPPSRSPIVAAPGADPHSVSATVLPSSISAGSGH